jgi:hypothetical protein
MCEMYPSETKGITLEEIRKHCKGRKRKPKTIEIKSK